MAYTFEDIEDVVIPLADLYAELALGDERRDYQFLIAKVLKVFETLRKEWNEYDRGRLQRMIAQTVDTKIKERRA